MKKLNKKGFTLVELLIAMALFSYVLTFASYGFVQINRQYVKSLTVRRTHGVARSIMDEFSRSVRYGTGIADIQNGSKWDGGDNNGVGKICFSNGVGYRWGDARYNASDAADKLEKNGTKGRLVKISGCGEGAGSSEFPMLDDDLAVWDIDFTKLGENSMRIKVILVSSGESVKFDPVSKEPTCAFEVGSGSQYCDAVKFESVITYRY